MGCWHCWLKVHGCKTRGRMKAWNVVTWQVKIYCGSGHSRYHILRWFGERSGCRVLPRAGRVVPSKPLDFSFFFQFCASPSARPRHLATSAWSFNEVVEATGAALTFTVTLPPRSLVCWKVEPTRSTDSGGRVQHLERWRKDFYFNLFIMKRTDKSIRNCHPIFPNQTVSRAW